MKTKTMTYDHRKIHSDLYRMKPGPVSVRTIPAMSYITQEMYTAYRMDWAGRPEPIDEAWLVWKVVNHLKHMTKNTMDYKFTRMPHEILWHEKKDGKSLATQMMQVPDCITHEMFDEAQLHVANSLKRNLPKMNLIHAEPVMCVQKLHIGHYRETIQTLNEVLDYGEQSGYMLDKSHREIYLTPAMLCHKPETWKTVVSVEIRN